MSRLRVPLLVLGLCAASAQAATLKALFVIADAYESEENNAIAESVRVDLATMTRLTHALEQAQVLPTQKVVLQGKKATGANVFKAISKLDVGADDTLLFYFSGHGGNDRQRSLLYGVDEEDLDRAKLEKELLAKKARLTIILTDACNNFIDDDSNSRSFVGAPKQPQDLSAQWRALFVSQRGVVHISAASPGEYAWSDNDEGGAFTHALVDEGLLKHPGSTWKDVFDQARQRTMASFNAFPRQQRAKLREEGITSQTPKAYQLTAQPADATPPPDATPTPQPQPQPPKRQDPPATAKVTITNGTSSTMMFLHDLNPDEANWSEARVHQYNLGRNKAQTLPAPAKVGWLNGDDSVVQQLEAGNYRFQSSDEGLVLVQDGAAPPPQGDEKRQQRLDGWRQKLVGTWQWEDSDEKLVTALGDDGSFVDKSQRGRVVERGTWALVTDKAKGKRRTYLAFTSKDKDGSVTEYRYRFKFTDDDTVSLVLRRTVRDGETVKPDESANMDDTVMMYRK